MDWDGLVDQLTAGVRDAFGEPVLYYADPEENPDVEPIAIRAIFDVEFLRVMNGKDIETGSSTPVIDVRLEDLVGLGRDPSQDDEVVVRGDRYKVSAKMPSSSRMWKLRLRRKGV